MKCRYPKTVRNPAYPNERVLISVPCRKCVACLKNYISDWTMRLIDESECSKKCYFLTLTYANEPEGYVKEHIQKYLKKIRNGNPTKIIRFFIVGERGNIGDRVHYHGIIFTDSFSDISQCLIDFWTHGFSKIGTVTPQSCSYVAKYIVPQSNSSVFKLMSRRPGIGAGKITPTYLRSQELNPRGFVQSGRFRKRLPRFYKDRLKSNGIILPLPDSGETYRLSVETRREYDLQFGQYDHDRFWQGKSSYYDQESEIMQRSFDKRLSKKKNY